MRSMALVSGRNDESPSPPTIISEVKLFKELEQSVDEEDEDDEAAVVPVTDAVDELQLLTIDTLLTLAFECTKDDVELLARDGSE